MNTGGGSGGSLQNLITGGEPIPFTVEVSKHTILVLALAVAATATAIIFVRWLFK